MIYKFGVLKQIESFVMKLLLCKKKTDLIKLNMYCQFFKSLFKLMRRTVILLQSDTHET